MWRLEMIKVKRALISVSDKTGILEFAKELHKLGVEILSTGGTAKLFRENNIPVKEVSEHLFIGNKDDFNPILFAGRYYRIIFNRNAVFKLACFYLAIAN